MNFSDRAGRHGIPDTHFVFLTETHGPFVARSRPLQAIFLAAYLADLLFAARRHGDGIATGIRATTQRQPFRQLQGRAAEDITPGRPGQRARTFSTRLQTVT